MTGDEYSAARRGVVDAMVGVRGGPTTPGALEALKQASVALGRLSSVGFDAGDIEMQSAMLTAVMTVSSMIECVEDERKVLAFRERMARKVVIAWVAIAVTIATMAVHFMVGAIFGLFVLGVVALFIGDVEHIVAIIRSNEERCSRFNRQRMEVLNAALATPERLEDVGDVTALKSKLVALR